MMAQRDLSTDRQPVIRFFWTLLVLATIASVAGNVCWHILSAPRGTWIAAISSVVPPAVLLGSTHGVALLVRSKATGRAYWSALVITALLACAAFVLSFDALRSLALEWGGFRSWAAWLWPVTIDLSIANSTIALLALTGQSRDSVAPVLPEVAPVQPVSLEPVAPLHLVTDEDEPEPAPVAELQHDDATVLQQPVDLPEPVNPLLQQADEMIASGVTRLDRDRLATVLQHLGQGVTESRVARIVGTNHTTVQRIAEACNG